MTARVKRHPAARLNTTQVKRIKRLLKKGGKPGTIATEYGVSWTCIAAIRDGLTWKHVA